MPRRTNKAVAQQRRLDFTGLVDAVRQVCERSAAVASRAVNVSLTLRNWLVGFYVVEYEQRGADRAQYGERLLERLANALADKGTAEMSARSLRLYRQFFLTYPGIWQSAIAKTEDSPLPGPIWRSLIAKSDKSRLFRRACSSSGTSSWTLLTSRTNSLNSFSVILCVADLRRLTTWSM